MDQSSSVKRRCDEEAARVVQQNNVGQYVVWLFFSPFSCHFSCVHIVPLKRRLFIPIGEWTIYQWTIWRWWRMLLSLMLMWVSLSWQNSFDTLFLVYKQWLMLLTKTSNFVFQPVMAKKKPKLPCQCPIKSYHSTMFGFVFHWSNTEAFCIALQYTLPALFSLVSRILLVPLFVLENYL